MGSIPMIIVAIGVVVVVFAIFSMKQKSKTNQQKTDDKNQTEKEQIVGVKRNPRNIVKKDMSEFIRFDKIANNMIYQKKRREIYNGYTM